MSSPHILSVWTDLDVKVQLDRLAEAYDCEAVILVEPGFKPCAAITEHKKFAITHFLFSGYSNKHCSSIDTAAIETQQSRMR